MKIGKWGKLIMNIGRLSLHAILCILFFWCGSVFSSDYPETPSHEAPDPLGQFLKHEYIKDKLSVFVETQLYSWENKNDATEKGGQLVTPVTITYQYDDFDFGLRRAYIKSENKSVGNIGKVSTWSDTALTLAYTFKNIEWPIRLSLDYNLPNGRASLKGNEKNAIMDSFLVQQTQFGEGKNITPGISVTKAFSNNDIFGIGMSFSKRGGYDPNGDVQNDAISPGDETIVTLQWQHNEANWMVIGGVIATSYGITKRNNIDYYRKGNKFDLNITTLHALPWEITNGQQLMLNLRYVSQSKDSNFDPTANALKKEASDSNPDTIYMALDWSKKWSYIHTFHLLLDYLKAKDNKYDEADVTYDAGKVKYGIGIAFDYEISDKSILSIKAKRFDVVDKSELVGVADSRYHGNNMSISLNYKF